MPTVTTKEPITNVKTPAAPQAPPPLLWVNGQITEILLQPKEKFYVVAVKDATKTVMVRFGDPYTGTSDVLSGCDATYQLVQQAFFNKQSVQVGFRDWGYDPQAGIERMIIDRVIVNH
jgi:hypothetical protein